MQHVQRGESQHPAFCCPGVPTDMVETYCWLDPCSFFLGLTGVRALRDRVASWVTPSSLAWELWQNAAAQLVSVAGCLVD